MGAIFFVPPERRVELIEIMEDSKIKKLFKDNMSGIRDNIPYASMSFLGLGIGSLLTQKAREVRERGKEKK